MCLLCIRSSLEAIGLNRANSCVASASTFLRSSLVTPPFQNPVESPGGYTRDSIGCGPLAQSAFVCPVNIVGSARSRIFVVFDPERKQAYVDQSALMWRPPSAQCQRDF